MTPISARSRRPTSHGTSVSEPSAKVTFFTTLMLASSRRACSSVSTGVLPRLTTCFGPRTACAGLMARTWPTIEPVEQHADRGQVLLDGRPCRCALLHGPIAGVRHLQRLDIGSDMERLDIDEPADAVLLEPGEERARRPGNRPCGCCRSRSRRRKNRGNGVPPDRRRWRSSPARRANCAASTS